MKPWEPEAIAILRQIIEGDDEKLGEALERGRAYLRSLPPTLRWIGTGDLDTIVEMTAKAHGLTVAEMLEPRHFASIAHARHVGMWLARNLTNAPLEKIARAFGKKDHGTVVWGVHAVEDRMATDPAAAAQINALRECVALAIHKRHEKMAERISA